MGNWKELGEVPDSDDEDFDTQSTGPGPEPQALNHHTAGVAAEDVWSVPSSPTEPPGSHPPSTELQCTEGAVLQRAEPQEESEDELGRHEQSIRSRLPPQFEAPSEPTVAKILSENDQISLSRVQITAPGSVLSQAAGPTLPPSDTPVPEWEEVPPPSRLRATPAASQERSGAPLRPNRSLRPRKPIQEHPYALENAQYSRFMKSHGIRPVRVGVAQEKPAGSEVVGHVACDEDSQDNDYTGPESQLSSRGAVLAAFGDSQASPGATGGDDVDELALSPSPRTSSPPRRLPVSSQPSDCDQTDNTSLLFEDDELPTLDQLAHYKFPPHARDPKRKQSSTVSPVRKRLKVPPSFWDISSSPETPPARQVRNTTRTRSPSSPVPQGGQASPEAGADAAADGVSSWHRDTFVIHEDGASDTDGSGDSSGSDSEIVRQNGKRIRGVLPASWLRLDQKTIRGPMARTASLRHVVDPPSDQPRRGIAVTRQAVSKPLASPDRFLQDLRGEEDADGTAMLRTQEAGPMQTSASEVEAGQDDDASVVEEDEIDQMLPKGKRPGRREGGHAPKKRRRYSKHALKGHQHQQDITAMLSVTGTTPSSRPKVRGFSSFEQGKRDPARASSGQAGSSLAPLLSILDFAAPDAPQFIRVAARTARKRADLGKSSPSRKHINLGSRRDNVDALSVLQDWRSGKIKPRLAHAPRRGRQRSKAPDAPRAPFHQVSGNAPSRPRARSQGLSFTKPTKIAKQTSIDNFVTSGVERSSKTPIRSRRHSSRQSSAAGPQAATSATRPAQLETTEQERLAKAGFVTRKRALDALYRKARRHLPSPSVDLDRFVRDNAPASHVGESTAGDATQPPAGAQHPPRPRLRKRRLSPARVDLSAPQYTHANDPLPARHEDLADLQDHPQEHRLKGLGPFGTYYTEHFDVFPLSSGVFFHESTLVGSGVLVRAFDSAYTEKLRHPRPGTSFGLGDQCLYWGPWSDTVSSELGVVFDLIMERLAATEGSSAYPVAVEASNFVLEYVLNSLSLEDDTSRDSCVARFAELLSALTPRLGLPPLHGEDRTTPRQRASLLQVQTPLVIVAFLLQRIAQDSSLGLSGTFRAEENLTGLAKMATDTLVQTGFDGLQEAYNDLQQLRARERGIRGDSIALHCWVVLIKVLEAAHIPRAAFWDIAYSSLMPPGSAKGCDVRVSEALWRNMFLLLPLCEFDNSGVLVSGLRHSDPLPGWALPQQLVKGVFGLYQTNPRQPPGFNDYCRALVSRCHHLVQQWGWYKRSSIIGTIFDFFGSQNLAHLRNEEAYKSPGFLEELAGSPTLSLKAEDRCFHIFLKTLASTIVRLRRLGLVKDIRNLVARTLPNHNRQYSKEQIVHQHELSALRNHHDLLCTLFWSAPPELRPPAHVIEKLVPPGSSHKEACLINLRAWNQLARFVISSSQDDGAYAPFTTWQSNVFQQVLDQYLSAAGDIQRQFSALSEDASRNITQDTVDKVVSKNRAVALDLLHFSVRGCLDVLRHAPSLHAATLCLNAGQLERIFSQLDMATPDFDWNILKAALEIIEQFTSRVEKAMDEEYSNDSAPGRGPDHLEEAILFFDQKLAAPLFSMLRKILRLQFDGSPAALEAYAACVEKAISLGSRVASRLIHSGVTRLVHYFTPGKYDIFGRPPNELDTRQKRHLPLFIAVLLKNNIFDLRDIGTSIFELWMTSVVKPLAAMRYESYLGETLMAHGFPYLEDVLLPPGKAPDYALGLDFFSSGISCMRRTLRSQDAPRRKQLRSDYHKILRLVMEQMKHHLKSLVSQPAAHQPYVAFVREIVATIKSHGADICPVDLFFYQPSQDYAPSMEDPQLHTAGIIAYGIRLGEGEVTVTPQLFHYLYNNFKIAVANGLVDEERSILEKGMSNPAILSFVIGQMVPAVIRAAMEVHEAWPLLDVYSAALEGLLTNSCLPSETPLGAMDDVAVLLQAILAWAKDKESSSGVAQQMTAAELHILSRLMALCNLLRSNLLAWMITCPASQAGGLVQLVESITSLANGALSHIEVAYDSSGDGSRPEGMFTRDLLMGVRTDGFEETTTPLRGDRSPHIDSFAKHIAGDIRKSWTVTPAFVTVAVPTRPQWPSGTQSGQGSKNELGGEAELLGALRGELWLWTSEMGRRLLDRPVRGPWEVFGLPL